MSTWFANQDGSLWTVCNSASTASNTWNELWMGQTATSATTSEYMQVVSLQQQTINSMMAQQCVWIDSNGNTITQMDRPRARPAPTPDEIAASNTRAELARTAGKKAEELLLSHLTPEQRETFIKGRWFVVQGKKRQYRIHGRTYAGNIEVLEGDKVIERLCCHCRADIPLHDHLLAQKIMLESAEADFIKIANRRSA